MSSRQQYLGLLASVIIFVCHYVVLTFGIPTITFITKNQIVNIGDDLNLRCNLADVGGNQYGWYRADSNNGQGRTQVIARGNHLDIPSSRFSPSFDSRTLQYNLRISQLNENDAGVYLCQISSGLNVLQTAKTNVSVRIPPIINDNSTRSVITSVGSNIVLQCYATGFPAPAISWRRNKNAIIPVNNGVSIYRGNKLTLSNISKDDRGTYYCVADNGVVPGARRSISVEIEFKPHVRVAQDRYEQALQYNSLLHCSVEAFPSPTITWLKDGVEINNNQHYEITIFDTTNEFSQTTLHVKKIEKRQFGIYVCKATNKFGSSEAEVRLDESPNVACPPACDIGVDN